MNTSEPKAHGVTAPPLKGGSGPIKLMHKLEALRSQMVICAVESPCAGWMHNQLGEGNNIGLRMWAINGLKSKVEVVGQQHRCFEDTLPGDEEGK